MSSSSTTNVKMSGSGEMVVRVRVPWYYGTEYQCRFCYELYWCSGDLTHHVKSVHSSSPALYLKKFGTFESGSSSPKISCQICGELLKRNHKSITTHLVKKHSNIVGLDSPEAYAKKFNIKNNNFIELKLDEENNSEEEENENLQIEDDDDHNDPSDNEPSSQEPESKKPRQSPSLNEISREASPAQPPPPPPPLKRRPPGLEVIVQPPEVSMDYFDDYAQQQEDESEVANETDDTQYYYEDNSTDGQEVHSYYEGSTEDEHLEQLARQWSNQCEYDCRLTNCTFKSNEYYILKKHIEKAHGIEYNHYKLRIGPLLTKKVVHECIICAHHQSGRQQINKFLHRIESITPHLRFKHNDLTLKEYYKTYILEKQKPPPMPDDTPNEDTEDIDDDDGMEGGGDALALEAKEWSNQCQYHCRFDGCPYKTTEYTQIRKHIERDHEMSYLEYKITKGPLMTQKFIHKCVICKDKTNYTSNNRLVEYQFLHRSGSISPHLRIVHNKMSLRTYYVKYILKRKSEDFSEEQTIEEDSEDRNLALLARNWSNQCEFNCRLCHQKFDAYGNLTAHLVRCHKTDIRTYRNDIGQPLTKSVMFHCRICYDQGKTEVTGNHTFVIINNHIKKHHNLSLKDYYVQYVHNQEQEEEVGNQAEYEEYIGNGDDYYLEDGMPNHHPPPPDDIPTTSYEIKVENIEHQSYDQEDFPENEETSANTHDFILP